MRRFFWNCVLRIALMVDGFMLYLTGTNIDGNYYYLKGKEGTDVQKKEKKELI